MKISDIANRTIPPAPWVEGEKIPWDEPGFSERMLKEHLSQDHDAASRRLEIVHRQVDYVERLLNGPGSRVLDLACGPGLHSLELSARGHSVRGVDFSPASIEWARSTAESRSLSTEFVHADLRRAEFGDKFDLVMLLFGEIDVFSVDDLNLILSRSRLVLKAGGKLLLEPHLPGVIRSHFETPPAWSASNEGLFSERPHLLLEEGFWHEDAGMAVKRWYVIDTETGEVDFYSQTVVEHDPGELAALIEQHGFRVVEAPMGWPEVSAEKAAEFYPLVAVAE